MVLAAWIAGRRMGSCLPSGSLDCGHVLAAMHPAYDESALV
jgi:hypothetical protein